MVGIEYGATKTKMNQNKLAQKRFRKAQKRKNKKYTGPKYSALDQMLMIAPLLERAGINILGEMDTIDITDNLRMSQPMSSELLPARKSMSILNKDGKQSSTSFTTE